MSSTQFEQIKTRILKSLEVEPESYTDLSPKGSIDENIKELIYIINSHPHYVTSSSCSGRVSIYVEGKKRPEDETEMVASTGGKGGGKWLMVEHDPIDLTISCWREDLLSSYNMKETTTKMPENASLIHIKFEPMVCLTFPFNGYV